MNQTFHIDIDIEFEKITEDQLKRITMFLDSLNVAIGEVFPDKIATKVHGRNI